MYIYMCIHIYLQICMYSAADINAWPSKPEVSKAPFSSSSSESASASGWAGAGR